MRKRLTTGLMAIGLIVATALPAFAVTYHETGFLSCSGNDEIHTRIYAVEDHYFYDAGSGTDFTIPFDATWHQTTNGGTGHVGTWAWGNRPPYNYSLTSSYGFCGP